MTRVVSVSRAELEAERKKILSRRGLTLDELRKQADVGALIAEEWDEWQRLCDIEFLLGDV